MYGYGLLLIKEGRTDAPYGVFVKGYYHLGPPTGSRALKVEPILIGASLLNPMGAFLDCPHYVGAKRRHVRVPLDDVAPALLGQLDRAPEWIASSIAEILLDGADPPLVRAFLMPPLGELGA